MSNPRGVKSKEIGGRPRSAKAGRSSWRLRLYVAGKSRRGVVAFNNLKMICDEELKDNYLIEVVDLVKHPRLAREHQILAVPTLVRTHPLPARSIIGDLSHTERVLAGLDLSPSPAHR
jgi:circadian clock protein KaiB